MNACVTQAFTCVVLFAKCSLKLHRWPFVDSMSVRGDLDTQQVACHRLTPTVAREQFSRCSHHRVLTTCRASISPRTGMLSRIGQRIRDLRVNLTLIRSFTEHFANTTTQVKTCAAQAFTPHTHQYSRNAARRQVITGAGCWGRERRQCGDAAAAAAGVD